MTVIPRSSSQTLNPSSRRVAQARCANDLIAAVSRTQHHRKKLIHKHALACLLLLPTVLCGGCDDKWRERDCSTRIEVPAIESPNQDMSFDVVHRVCASGFASGSEEFWVDVSDKRATPQKDTQVFHDASSHAPLVTWSPTGILNIMLDAIPQEIKISYKEFMNKSIDYRVSSRLDKSAYEAALASFRKRAIDDINNRYSTDVNHRKAIYPGKDINEQLVLLDKRLKIQEEDYDTFARWMKDHNASIAAAE